MVNASRYTKGADAEIDMTLVSINSNSKDEDQEKEDRGSVSVLCEEISLRRCKSLPALIGDLLYDMGDRDEIFPNPNAVKRQEILMQEIKLSAAG